MKYIRKQREPKEFIDWKAKASADWQPTFDNLRGSPTGVDDIVKQALILEQGGICCYCEQQITMDNSHIEHFLPRKFYPKETADYNANSLDYDNLLCSCIKEPCKNIDTHCGHYKDRNERYDRSLYEKKILISPLDSSCEQRFKYVKGKGTIEPVHKNDIAAEKTIYQLGLNNGDLPERRKQIIDIFNGAGRDPLTEADIDDFTVDDQRKYAERYLLPDEEDGSFNEFWTTIQYLLKQLPPS